PTGTSRHVFFRRVLRFFGLRQVAEFRTAFWGPRPNGERVRAAVRRSCGRNSQGVVPAFTFRRTDFQSVRLTLDGLPIRPTEELIRCLLAPGYAGLPSLLTPHPDADGGPGNANGTVIGRCWSRSRTGRC